MDIVSYLIFNFFKKIENQTLVHIFVNSKMILTQENIANIVGLIYQINYFDNEQVVTTCSNTLSMIMTKFHEQNQNIQEIDILKIFLTPITEDIVSKPNDYYSSYSHRILILYLSKMLGVNIVNINQNFCEFCSTYIYTNLDQLTYDLKNYFDPIESNKIKAMSNTDYRPRKVYRPE